MMVCPFKKPGEHAQHMLEMSRCLYTGYNVGERFKNNNNKHVKKLTENHFKRLINIHEYANHTNKIICIFKS